MSTQPQLQKLLNTAQTCVKKGDYSNALSVLTEAKASFPDSHELFFNIAVANRLAGNLADAIQALDEALALDPYSFLALLSKASILEQTGQVRRASEIYRNAISIAPNAKKLPENLQDQLNHAQRVVNQQAIAQASYLRDFLGSLSISEPAENKRRFEEAIDIASGAATPFHAKALQLHYPGLPAIPFFDRAHFPWFEELEAATPLINSELSQLTSQRQNIWAPYVQYKPGTPENQFAELNHNINWSSIWLWKDGERQQVADAFPKTLEVLEKVPLAEQQHFAPTVLFSGLAPHTHIPPHTGSTNTRLLVHLPIVIPGAAFFRVGNERRQWQLGTAWAFDDTIEHETWNDCDEKRVILIFDVWNPLLSISEVEKVGALLSLQRAWLNEERQV